MGGGPPALLPLLADRLGRRRRSRTSALMDCAMLLVALALMAVVVLILSVGRK